MRFVLAYRNLANSLSSKTLQHKDAHGVYIMCTCCAYTCYIQRGLSVACSDEKAMREPL